MIAVYNVMQLCCSPVTGNNSNSRLSNGATLAALFAHLRMHAQQCVYNVYMQHRSLGSCPAGLC